MKIEFTAPKAKPAALLRPWALVVPAVLFLLVFFVVPLVENGLRSVVNNAGGFTL